MKCTSEHVPHLNALVVCTDKEFYINYITFKCKQLNVSILDMFPFFASLSLKINYKLIESLSHF